MRSKRRQLINVGIWAAVCMLAAAMLLAGYAASASGAQPTALQAKSQPWSDKSRPDKPPEGGPLVEKPLEGKPLVEKPLEGKPLVEKRQPDSRLRFEIPSRPQLLRQLQPPPQQDSRELQLQDMLMLLLLPHMEHELAKGYADVLKSPPMLYPYYVDVVNTERLNGFRGFSLRIVLDAVPTVGPHIAVGEDKFTFDISPIADVKLVRYEHVKGPDPSSFPPNYKDLLK